LASRLEEAARREVTSIVGSGQAPIYRRPMTRLFIFMIALLAAAPLRADDTPSEVFLAGKQGKLQAYLWRPAGPGPFPALVYNHGSERDPIAGLENEMGPYLAKQGYVVLFPYRRGAGKSEGTYWRDRVDKLPEEKQEAAAIQALVEENDDVVTAISWLRAQRFVDGKNVSVAGCSFGGIESLLTAERPLGLNAVIDFAGGSMSWNGNPLLRERMLQAAEHAQAPVFFLQAENDFNTAPSKVLSEAMRKKNLPYRVRIFPPHGLTPRAGHAHFCNHGSSEWGPDVLDFLRHRH
jgi:dienelactone hydrolase